MVSGRSLCSEISKILALRAHLILPYVSRVTLNIKNSIGAGDRYKINNYKYKEVKYKQFYFIQYNKNAWINIL